MSGFDCSRCGKHHDTLPRNYGQKAPYPFFLLGDEERDKTHISSDQCVLAEKDFYLFGTIVVPVQGEEDPLTWGVWAEVAARDFARYCEMWEEPARVAEPPIRGTLQSLLPGYPDTVGLAVVLRTREVGLRPLIEVVSEEHPLGREQKSGITGARLREVAEAVLHG
jgi:hypothetical protein